MRNENSLMAVNPLTLLSRKKSLAEWKNNQVYLDYYYRLSEMALHMFKWNNLPETVDERFLEMCLFDKGKAVFFKSKDNDGLLCLNVMIDGKFNVYRNPIRRLAYAITGMKQQLTIDNSVIIWNNRFRTPTTFTIELFAERLANVQRTIDVNVLQQKYPAIIKCSEQQRQSFQGLVRSWRTNEPLIFASNDIDMSNIEVLSLDTTFNIDKLEAYKHEVWNEAMTFLGVPNTKQDKKERLVTAEAEGNNIQIELARQVMLTQRQQACEEINRMFGTNISVEFRCQAELDAVEEFEPDDEDRGDDDE